MDLERDLFTVTAEEGRPAEAELIAAVEAAGFKATVERPGQETEPVAGPAEPAGASDAMPPLLQDALDRAGRDGKLVLVDFYADWCAPCRRMLDETYKDSQVLSELEDFVFLKIDTDDDPGIAKRFGVAAIPDARVLGPDGTEVARFVGFKTPDQVLKVPSWRPGNRRCRPAIGGGEGGRKVRGGSSHAASVRARRRLRARRRARERGP